MCTQKAIVPTFLCGPPSYVVIYPSVACNVKMSFKGSSIVLCCVCEGALSSYFSKMASSSHDTGYLCHHTNLVFLRDAAIQECYICRIVWDNITRSETQPTGLPALLHGSKEVVGQCQASYRLYHDLDGHGKDVLRLDVFLDEVGKSWRNVFFLIPADGKSGIEHLISLE